MVGEKSEEMIKRGLEWKNKSVKAHSSDGGSYFNFDKLVEKILLSGEYHNYIPL